MATVLLVHWHEAEGTERAKQLRAAGHTVRLHWSSEEHATWTDDPPEVVVISLDRLPSHGRAVAGWVWEAKKRQHIPIVFAGGKPDKVVATREQFPAAVYCANEELADILGRLSS
jgi:hypothetical protein